MPSTSQIIAAIEAGTATVMVSDKLAWVIVDGVFTYVCYKCHRDKKYIHQQNEPHAE